MRRALLLLLQLWWAGPVVADTVLSVGDGDTLTVTGAQDRRTIRLACIDAQETAQRPDGPSARAALQQLVPVGSHVEVRASTVGRYGRTVAELWRAATNVKISLVRQGHAFVYRQYLQALCSATAYLSAEQQAERDRLGVWSAIRGIHDPGISGATATGRGMEAPNPVRPRQPVTPADPSAITPEPRSCCDSATVIWMETATGKPANLCAELRHQSRRSA